MGSTRKHPAVAAAESKWATPALPASRNSLLTTDLINLRLCSRHLYLNAFAVECWKFSVRCTENWYQIRARTKQEQTRKGDASDKDKVLLQGRISLQTCDKQRDRVFFDQESQTRRQARC